MIEGVIFDMDGVLVNNLDQHIRAWQRLGRELGRDLAPDDVRRLFGRRNDEILRELIDPALSADRIVLLGEHKEELYRSIMAQELEPMEGLPEFLEHLRHSGLRLALATSACPENVDLVLGGLQARGYFTAVVTGADVTRSKPDPEIFLLAARLLELPAERCIVFEDSTSGITAACRAGCTCVALATTHSEDELSSLPAVRSIPDYRGLTVSDLQEWAGTRPT